MDYSKLIYYSNKLKTYLTNKFNTITDSVSALSTKVDSDKQELENKIIDSSNALTTVVQNVDNKVDNVDNKVINLKTQVDNIDISPIDGDTLNINDVNSYMFRNVTAGQIITIPNTSNSTDYIIECFTEVDAGTVIDYTVIQINENTTDKFIYDPNYIDVASDGVKPKDTVYINFTKQSITVNETAYETFESDFIPADIVNAMEDIISLSEETI